MNTTKFGYVLNGIKKNFKTIDVKMQVIIE